MRRIRWTKDLVLKELFVKFNGKYTACIDEYKNNKQLINLHCNSCKKQFTKSANALFSKSEGCPHCSSAGRRMDTFQEFVQKAISTHGDSYEYVGLHTDETKAIIVCKACNHRFLQSRSKHVFGQGCPICRYKKVSKVLTKDTCWFIAKATEVHGSRFSYTESEYTGTYSQIKVRCNNSGLVFTTTPNEHLRGTGCLCCGSWGFNSTKPSVLYLITCESCVGSFVGYGITSDFLRRVSEHTNRLSKSAFVIAQQHTWDFPIGSSALALENAVKKQFPQTSRLGCAIEGFKRESTDAPFEQVKEFIESILKENPEWQLT